MSGLATARGAASAVQLLNRSVFDMPRTSQAKVTTLMTAQKLCSDLR